MVLRIIQPEALRIDDIRLVVAREQIRTVKRFALATVVVLNRSLKLLHSTRQRNHGEVHILVRRQVRTAVLRPGEVDITIVGHAQELLTTRCRCIGAANERAIVVVGLHHHARQRIVGAFAGNYWNIDVADLGFFPFNDHMVVKAFPAHRDRVAFNVFTRPRVHNCGKSSAFSRCSFQAVSVVLEIFSLPCVTHRIISISLRELLDLVFAQVRIEVQVPLGTAPRDLDGLISFRSDRTLISWQRLTGSHGRNLADIEVGAE